jgi:hypothetical protein
MAFLKNNCNNLAVQSRVTMGLQPWIGKYPRKVFTAIIRLRSGHNKLNHFVGKWDPNTSQQCPNGCDENENITHVLLDCHAYDEERKTMVAALRSLNTPIDLPSILGLNPNIPKSTQHKIIKHLIQFIIDTEIMDRI